MTPAKVPSPIDSAAEFLGRGRSAGEFIAIPTYRDFEGFSYRMSMFDTFDLPLYLQFSHHVHKILTDQGFKTVAVKVEATQYSNWLAGRQHGDQLLREHVQNRWDTLYSQLGEVEARKLLKSQRRRRLD